MHLSKTAYYADFAIYALMVVWLAILASLTPGWPQRLLWLAMFATGLALWTLLEYLLHRWVLHRVPLIAPLHTEHHRAPRALVGTPTWLSLAIIWGAFFLPLWRVGSFIIASGLTAGVMGAFLWYGVVHHVIHHGRPRALAAWLSDSKRRHLRHHFSSRPVNFGVTTALWDHLFGTADQPARAGAHRQGAH